MSNRCVNAVAASLQVTLSNDDDIMVKSTCPGGEFVVLEVGVFVKGVQEVTVIFNARDGTTITLGTVRILTPTDYCRHLS